MWQFGCGNFALVAYPHVSFPITASQFVMSIAFKLMMTAKVQPPRLHHLRKLIRRDSTGDFPHPPPPQRLLASFSYVKFNEEMGIGSSAGGVVHLLTLGLGHPGGGLWCFFFWLCKIIIIFGLLYTTMFLYNLFLAVSSHDLPHSAAHLPYFGLFSLSPLGNYPRVAVQPDLGTDDGM